MTKEEFASRLVDACPETRPIVDEHREDFDNDILLHLLIADVLRFAIAAFEAGDEDASEQVARCSRGWHVRW